jgi:hypothetical protein
MLVTGLALWISLAALAIPPGASDRGADGRFSERDSMHFVVFEDVAIERSGRRRQFERQVLGVLESAYDRVGSKLGLRPRSKIRAVIYDPEVFDASFSGRFTFPAVGFFDRVIHIRGAERVDNRLAQTLHHEYTHAALAAASPSYRVPGWVNEGLAEWFEALAVGRRGLTGGQLARLAEASRAGNVPTLRELESPSFVGMDPARAGLAYLKSYATIEHLERRHGARSLRRFVDELLRTRSVNRALGRAFRLDLDKLEARLEDELR